MNLLLREDGANDGFSIRAFGDVRAMVRTVITASTAIELRLIIFLHIESYLVVNSRRASGYVPDAHSGRLELYYGHMYAIVSVDAGTSATDYFKSDALFLWL